MSKKSNMNKDDFLSVLCSLSRDDIRKLILEKGKEPKLVTPVGYYK